ncbi:hypothetical protein ACIBG8_42995 [Nonomuraea sp. NPDC050556]|uniref:hypothetical protein n=1 Tax=Nonomuraea sp. NPDC050556 TaxID=3364369 RepID=UPI0037938B4D
MSTIIPGAIGLTAYTIADSANAWFYLDIELDAGEQAELELHCPVAAAVTLAESGGPPITLSTTGAIPADATATRIVNGSGTQAGGGAVVLVTIEATNPFHTAWQLRVGAVVPPQTVHLQINAGDAEIRRILADPVATAAPPAALTEKTPISLTGSANYTTVPAGPGPAGTPAPPVLRATWTQTAPASISAPPPSTLFSTTIANVPLNASIQSSPAFRAPVVYAEQSIGYRLTAFYDDVPNMTPDPAEPVETAEVTLTVRPRTQHMILAVDRSGSMLALMPGTTLTRWEFARQAAHVWADLWIALRGQISPADRAGIMIYEASTCGWTGKPSGPIEILLPKNGTLGGLSALDVTSLGLGNPGACTPIGDALIVAIDEFVGIGGTPDDRYVLMQLTDGMENSNAVVVEDDSPVPQGATATFRSQRGAGARATVDARLAIYTIGLGPRGTVQDSVLDDLATGSPTDRGLYRPVQANQLMSAFGEMLGHALEAENVTPPDPNDDIAVSAGENHLTFTLRWKSINDRIKVFRTVGGVEQQVAGPGAVVAPGITVRLRANHGLVDVDLTAHLGAAVPASTWRVEYWENGTGLKQIAPGDLLVLVDLFLKADIRFDRVRYLTGQRALVTCQVTAGGESVKDAKVYAELARPGEGLGTFLAVNGSGYKPAGQNVSDPLAPKAAMLADLLHRKERQGLLEDVPKGIFRDGTDQLWDDGRHQDGIRDDGTYTNTYAGVEKEGMYNWRFTIRGTTPDGHPFLRVAHRSFWAGVGVDPEASKVEIKQVEHEGEGDKLRTVMITVSPVDARGERLGPFRASVVQIRSKQGQFQPFSPVPSDGVAYPQPDNGELLSRYDGRYSRIFTYNPADHPIVTIVVQGRRFPELAIP